MRLIMPEPELFITYSDKNMDFCIDRLKDAPGEVVSFAYNGLDLFASSTYDHFRYCRKEGDPVEFDYYPLKKMRAADFGYKIEPELEARMDKEHGYMDIPELEYWRKNLDYGHTRHSKLELVQLPDDSFTASNLDYLIDILKDLDSKYLIVRYKGGGMCVFHECEITGAESHGVEFSHFRSIRGLICERRKLSRVELSGNRDH